MGQVHQQWSLGLISRSVVLWLSASTAFGSGGVNVINKKIRAANLGWVAGDSDVSGLSDADKNQLAGVPLREVVVGENFGRHNFLLEGSLPETLDWRNHDGTDFVTPVKSQGRCGSCVAFAAVSTVETQFNIATQSAAKPWTFSPQHLFACGGGSCDRGWYPSEAVDFLNGKGVPDAACFPYVSGAVGEDVRCKNTCNDADLRSQKTRLRVRSQPILGASIGDLKQALLAGPVIATMKVFEDFYFYKSGVYRHAHGKVVGGHAVTIVGWSNADEAWIVRNSWGTDWGMHGDFLISWEDSSGIGATFFGVEPAVPFLGITLEGIRDRQFLHSRVQIALRGHGIKPEAATLEIIGATKELSSYEFSEDGEISMDTNELADGAYTMRARAKIPGGADRFSQTYIIFVRNQKASATLAIKRMTPNMNVWETIAPQFAITSTPVPLGEVRYRVEDAQGQTVLRRSAPHAADLMAISLNPGNLTLGKFVLVGEAVADDGQVLASDRIPFNVIEP
jgi:Papain family cysteine protease